MKYSEYKEKVRKDRQLEQAAAISMVLSVLFFVLLYLIFRINVLSGYLPFFLIPGYILAAFVFVFRSRRINAQLINSGTEIKYADSGKGIIPFTTDRDYKAIKIVLSAAISGKILQRVETDISISLSDEGGQFKKEKIIFISNVSRVITNGIAVYTLTDTFLIFENVPKGNYLLKINIIKFQEEVRVEKINIRGLD
jgi:hypothetical protein